MPSTPSTYPVRPGLAPKEHENTRLIALSFDGPSSPSVTLKGFERCAHGQPYGWGFAWYPEQSAAALVVKDATSIGDNAMTKLLREWERFQSTLFVSHLRGSARGLAEQDTHPFSRSFGSREWVFAHNGDLEGDLKTRLPLESGGVIVPVGRTDSEHAFCWLLSQCHKVGASNLAEVGWPRLHEWLQHVDGLGTSNIVLTDGRDLAVYSDAEGYNRLHWARLLPPDVPEDLVTDDVDIGLGDAKDRSRTVMLFWTQPPTDVGFAPMQDGQLIVVRRGAFIYDSHEPNRLMVPPMTVASSVSSAMSAAQQPAGLQASASGVHDAAGESNQPDASSADGMAQSTPLNSVDDPADGPPQATFIDGSSRSLNLGLPYGQGDGMSQAQGDGMSQAQGGGMPQEQGDGMSQEQGDGMSQVQGGGRPQEQGDGMSQAQGGGTSQAQGNGLVPSPDVPTASAPHFFARSQGLGRLLSVEHVTSYTYDKPVDRSTHLLRLQPVHDRWQDLLDYELSVSSPASQRLYHDVFGNQALRIEIGEPFEKLVFRARSLVRVRGEVREDLHSPTRRSSIPLVWMPWQRQMMTPYLLPPELPETQLQELIDFAMSFVERQDYDLVQTLFDMNTTIYRDFKYVSGSTTMATTPFHVYTQRRGVCQDFANLLICLARLLSVPARYRVGYIYTGSDYENTVQSDASHAWAELYLPWFGWQGFDPTNGCLVNQDHIRVACGRNYGDATPTSGTIYKGGGNEKLSVEVRVEEV